MPSFDLPQSVHAVVQVANGGYVVTAWTRNDKPDENGDEFSYTTSVFTEVDTMGEYIKRVCVELEGPGDSLQPGDKLGGLSIS